MSANDIQKVIIFGATGAIGTSLAEYLSHEHPQWEILAVSRNPSSPSRLQTLKLPNVKIVQGDSFDKTKLMEISSDCDIIYSCIGFVKYERKCWAKHWPLTVDNLLAAVVDTSGTNKKKKLVFCVNLYAYGNPSNAKISPKTTPVEASLNSKPNIRALIRQTFEKHIQEHPNTCTVVGGTDFFGPHVTSTSFLGDTMTSKIVGGSSALAIGSADKIHDFCFVADFAKALAVASVNDAAYDHFWICPHAIHGKTMRQIATDIATHANQPAPKVTVTGKWMVKGLSPFLGLMKEMKEMLVLWTEDYDIDDSEFIKAFGVQATPYDKALEANV